MPTTRPMVERDASAYGHSHARGRRSPRASATATATGSSRRSHAAVTVIGDAGYPCASGPGTAYPIVGRPSPVVAAEVSGRDDTCAVDHVAGRSARSGSRQPGAPRPASGAAGGQVAPAPTVPPQPSAGQHRLPGEQRRLHLPGQRRWQRPAPLTSGFDPARAGTDSVWPSRVERAAAGLDLTTCARTRRSAGAGQWRVNPPPGYRTAATCFCLVAKTIGRQVCIGDFCFDIHRKVGLTIF